MRFKSSICERTGRTSGKSLERLIAELNPLLLGGFGYCKQAHSCTFGRLERLIRRRLRAVLRKQSKRPGLGRCRADHQGWPNAFFAAAGLFALYPAWQVEKTPDEVTTDWRAVCGRTARTVRREGRREPSLPLSGIIPSRGREFIPTHSNPGSRSNPLNLRKTDTLRLARGPEFGSIFTVDS